MPKRKNSSRHSDHEGAHESSQPDEPRSREVLTPDWASLEKAAEKKAATGKRGVSRPAIDRHR